MCLSVSFYARCLSACVSVCFLICLTVYLHVWSDCMFFPNTCLHVCSLCPMSVLIFIPVRVSVYIFLFVWQSACLSSVCLFICLSLLFYLPIFPLYVCLSTYLSSVCLFICIFFLPVISLSVWLSVCLSSVCLSVFHLSVWCFWVSGATNCGGLDGWKNPLSDVDVGQIFKISALFAGADEILHTAFSQLTSNAAKFQRKKHSIRGSWDMNSLLNVLSFVTRLIMHIFIILTKL